MSSTQALASLEKQFFSELSNAGTAIRTYTNNVNSKTNNSFYQTLQYYEGESFMFLAGITNNSIIQSLSQYSWYRNSLIFLFSTTGEYVEIGLASLLVIYMFSGSSKPAVK
jgi:hypothetical protein